MTSFSAQDLMFPVSRLWKLINFPRLGVASNWFGLACPAHCSPSSLSAFRFSFLLGLLSGLILAAALFVAGSAGVCFRTKRKSGWGICGSSWAGCVFFVGLTPLLVDYCLQVHGQSAMYLFRFYHFKTFLLLPGHLSDFCSLCPNRLGSTSSYGLCSPFAWLSA